jgi:hypothetical protein
MGYLVVDLTKTKPVQQDHVEYQAAQQSRATDIKSKSNKLGKKQAKRGRECESRKRYNKATKEIV